MKDYFVAFAIIFVVVGSIIIQATNIYFSYGDKNYSRWDKISIASFLSRILEKKHPLAKPILEILETGFLIYLLYLYIQMNN